MTKAEAQARLKAEFPHLKIVRAHCGFELRDMSLEEDGVPQQWRYGFQNHTRLLAMARLGMVPVAASWAGENDGKKKIQN